MGGRPLPLSPLSLLFCLTELAEAFDEGCKADLHAGNVGEGGRLWEGREKKGSKGSTAAPAAAPLAAARHPSLLSLFISLTDEDRDVALGVRGGEGVGRGFNDIGGDGLGGEGGCGRSGWGVGAAGGRGGGGRCASVGDGTNRPRRPQWRLVPSPVATKRTCTVVSGSGRDAGRALSPARAALRPGGPTLAGRGPMHIV